MKSNIHLKLFLFQAVEQITFYGGRTNVADGLRTLRTQLFNTNEDRPEAPNIALVITDGGANVNEKVDIYVLTILKYVHILDIYKTSFKIILECRVI